MFRTIKTFQYSIISLLVLSFAVFVSFFLINTIFVAEAEEVNLIEELPKGEAFERGPNLLPQYISTMFKYTLSAAVVLALMFIVIGGIRYTLTSVSPSEKGAAKTMIFNAIFGLLIILLAYVVLVTINPDFVKLDFKITGGPSFSPPSAFGMTFDPNKDQINRDTLTGSCAGGGGSCISINKGACITSIDTNCTSVGGLQQNTIDGIVNINETCECVVVVTGGNEGGHSNAHSQGLKADLRTNPEMDEYIINNTTPSYTINLNGNSNTQVREGVLPNGQKIKVIDEREKVGNSHWDIEFLNT